MARSEHLPIYKAAYDLCLWLEQVVRGFSRYHSEPREVAAASAIGSDLRTISRRILRLVVRANARIDKTQVLLQLREEIEEMKAMLPLCCRWPAASVEVARLPSRPSRIPRGTRDLTRHSAGNALASRRRRARRP